MVVMIAGACFCFFSMVYHDMQWDVDSSTTQEIAARRATAKTRATVTKKPVLLPQHENHYLENSATLLESVASLVQQHVRAGNDRPWSFESVISVRMLYSHVRHCTVHNACTGGHVWSRHAPHRSNPRPATRGAARATAPAHASAAHHGHLCRPRSHDATPSGCSRRHCQQLGRRGFCMERRGRCQQVRHGAATGTTRAGTGDDCIRGGCHRAPSGATTGSSQSCERPDCNAVDDAGSCRGSCGCSQAGA